MVTRKAGVIPSPSGCHICPHKLNTPCTTNGVDVRIKCYHRILKILHICHITMYFLVEPFKGL